MELPDVEELIESAGSKYSLCVAVAKRARNLGGYISARKKMERINVIHPLLDIETDDSGLLIGTDQDSFLAFP